MASRIIAQMVVNGVMMVGKAAVQAYQQALANAKSPGAHNAVKNAVKKRMNYDQALQVLNIEKEAVSVKLVKEQYEKYYNMNDPTKGGSFYLQSKIFRAQESVFEELGLDESGEMKRNEGDKSASDSDTGDNDTSVSGNDKK